jgi:hypothetical protein
MSDMKTYMVLGFFVLALTSGFFSSKLPSMEHFVQKSAGMPLNGPAMGPYDTSMGGWMSSEHMPVGNTPQNKAVEGNKMMYLVGNQVSSKCGPTMFSTDTGYVCLTESDKNFLSRRFGNK